MSELLSCPFCGGEAHISASSDGYGVGCWSRRCIDMQMEQIPTEAEAVEAWNTRAERTCKNEWAKFDGFRCSKCWTEITSIETNYSVPMFVRYCPNCGARVTEVD